MKLRLIWPDRVGIGAALLCLLVAIELVATHVIGPNSSFILPSDAKGLTDVQVGLVDPTFIETIFFTVELAGKLLVLTVIPLWLSLRIIYFMWSGKI